MEGKRFRGGTLCTRCLFEEQGGVCMWELFIFFERYRRSLKSV